MVRLARNYNRGFLPTSVIAQGRKHSQEISGTDSSRTKRAKLVNSKQGKVGGYYLLKSPDEVSLADIYRIFDGPIALTPCVSLNFTKHVMICVDEGSMLSEERTYDRS